MQEAAEERATSQANTGGEPGQPSAARLAVRHTRAATGGHFAESRRVAEWRRWFAWGLARGFAGALAQERDFGHFFLFVPVVLGAGAAIWFSVPAPPSAVSLGALLAVFSLATLLSRHRHPLWHYLFFAVALAAGGMLLADVETRRKQTVVLDSPVTTRVTGVVEARERGASGEWRYVLAVTGTADPVLRRPPSRASFVARARHAPFAIGVAITGRARMSPPSGPALPGLNDFAFSSYFDGIGAVGYFLGAPEASGAGAGSMEGLEARLSAVLLHLRGTISERIRETIGGDAGAFAAAIVTGERRAMSKETVENLRRTGLAHVIAISGLHMALAAGLFFVGLRVVLSQFTGFAQAFPTKKIAAFGALLTAFSYLLISGAQVSAERAFMMMAIMLVAVMLDRPAISLRNVALAAIVILALSPSEVMGPSFQMSFAATVALIAGYAAWRGREVRDARFGFLPKIPVFTAVWRFCAGLMLTSLIGGLSTALFSIEHFHRIAGYSLPANLAAMPIIALVVMPAGLMAMILMPFGLDWPFLKIMGLGLSIVIDLVDEIAGWGGEIGAERLPRWALPVLVCGMLLLTLLRSRLRLAGAAVIAAALAALALLPREPPADLLISEDGALVAFAGEEHLASNRARPPSFIFSQWQEALQRPDHLKPAAEAHETITTALKEREAHQRLAEPLMAEARVAMAAMMDRADDGRFTCLAKAWCVGLSEGGIRVITVEEAAFAGIACDLADLVITPRRLNLERCRSGATLVTAAMLRKTGALEIWLPHQRGSAGEPGEVAMQGSMPGHDGNDGKNGNSRRAEPARPTAIRAAFSGSPRPWSLHRRYDWRSGRFDTSPSALLAINDSGG